MIKNILILTFVGLVGMTMGYLVKSSGDPIAQRIAFEIGYECAQLASKQTCYEYFLAKQ